MGLIVGRHIRRNPVTNLVYEAQAVNPNDLAMAASHEATIAESLPVGPARTYHEMTSTFLRVAAHLSRHAEALREAAGHV